MESPVITITSDDIARALASEPITMQDGRKVWPVCHVPKGARLTISAYVAAPDCVLTADAAPEPP